ncbi:MAG: hypothetical protein ACFE95_02115 [Candidatus Hodarchaeota archaeon]
MLIERKVLGILIIGFIIVGSLFLGALFLSLPNDDTPNDLNDNEDLPKSPSRGNCTLPILMGKVTIAGIGEFSFNASKVPTLRPDIFNEGYFSVFDVLVYIGNQSKITIQYHFNDSMNTFVVDSLNNKTNWWYRAHYDGGWTESNIFRMDHFPYKDKMTITVFQESEKALHDRYVVFTKEVQQKKENNNSVIVPEVTIVDSKSSRIVFSNVTITPHNIREDMLKADTITAIDVILSLTDQGKIVSKIQWYESIGTAEIVEDFYVVQINNDVSSGFCGFVYEEGSKGYAYNHIHIPSDIRVLNSPEYVLWFWIELGPCF